MVLAGGANFCDPNNAIFCYISIYAVNKKDESGYVLMYLNLAHNK